MPKTPAHIAPTRTVLQSFGDCLLALHRDGHITTEQLGQTLRDFTDASAIAESLAAAARRIDGEA